ncbi:MAG: alpha-E domain-containing protein [Rhodobacter sp.]|nr:alpha-E domain-containing protein [Paracoccaceae bacterium]MCC0075100.1 alpha-E domain-containing protein [Rhodobacter sp.]
MLSRTADNLFWLARYMERAETAARLLDVGARIALLPNAGHGYRNEWDALLSAGGTRGAFAAKYGEPVQRNIESHLFFDHDNPSSVATCITRARENGRIVRTALTTQVWDALNTAFQELRQIERTPRSEQSLNQLTEWTMRHAAMVRGAIDATLLRNDGWDFLNLGYFVERADNTARLLDVKYYVLLPGVEFVGSGLDNYQWRTLLRALGLHRAFHWAYGGEVTATKIAHFLILNPQSPRSLITCAEGLNTHMARLARAYRKSTDAQKNALNLLARIAETRTDDIFDDGLHEFLTSFIDEVGALSLSIHDSYLSGDAR